MSVRIQSHPLTSPQLDIFQDQILKGESPAYNIGGYLDLTGALDVGLFQRAFRLLVRNHDSFRISITMSEDGVPAQRIDDTLDPPLTLLDVSASASPDEEARDWIQARMNEPFSLEAGPLFRCALIRIGESRFFWSICVHHLIADGWAIDRVFSSLAEIYRALRDGIEPPGATPSYLEAVTADAEYLRSDRFEKDRAFWLGEYKDLPEPLLSPRTGDAVRTTSAECSWSLTDAMRVRIDELVAESGSSKFQLLLALFGGFLLRMKDRDELTIGLSVLNRRNALDRQIVGLFANVIAVPLPLEAGQGLLDFSARIGAILRRRYRHQRFPIGRLNKELDLFGHQRPQLYEVSMSYENGGRALLFGDASGVVVRCSTDHEATPLRLCVRDNLETGDVAIYLMHDRSFVEDDEARLMQQRFTAFMDAALADPHRALTGIPVSSPDDLRRLRDWAVSPAPWLDETSLHGMFEKQVARQGDAVAIIHGSASLDYAGLDARANRIAAIVASHGIRPDDRVALCAARGIDTIAAMLGILKAGGAYVPVDPAYASARTRQVMEDARPVLLLADEAGRAALRGAGWNGTAATCPTVALDLPLPAPAATQGGAASDADVAPHHLAYVIYTSGSTGRPKGVMVEHRNVLHQVAALRDAYGLEPDERMLQFSSISFDMSVEEIFPALLTGATLVLRDEECLHSPAAFAAFCAEHRITSLNLPSGFWAQIALAPPDIELPPSVRRVASGGDAVSPAALAAWFGRRGHRPALFNAYGPTEATVNAALMRLENAHQSSCIGRPLPGSIIHLLDRFGLPVPPGEVGEIVIGGAGVARGYLGAPDRTAERFATDPSAPDARLYRSGDLGRHDPDGRIEFLGRADHQVKIRGFRLETGEIEQRLLELPEVREVAVLAWGERPDQRLAAFVVPGEASGGGDADADADALLDRCRDALQGVLPDYMVPSAFIRLDALPLTASGKLDRKALPDPGLARFGRRDWEAPRDVAEQRLASLWQELLGLPRIGRHDSFFELGGHSLVAMRLLGRIREELGRTVPMRLLFEHPTLSGLAAALHVAATADTNTSEPSAAPAPIVPVPRDAAMMLSRAQQRLWFLSQLDDTGAAYHIPIVLRLAGEIDADVLRRGLDHLLQRHEALRTVFLSADGQPFATVLPDDTRIALAEHDLSNEADIEAAASARAIREAQEPFDLRRGPLIRATLLRLGDRRSVLLLTLHHIAGDGWSMEVLARELGAACSAFAAGKPPVLPPLPIQYPDYAAWQHSAATAGMLTKQRAYWRDRLRDAPELLRLPTDRPRPPRQSFAGAAVPVRIGASLCRAISVLCRRHQVTPFMVLATAWSMVLCRLTGQDDVALGTLSANRGQREIEGLIGFFVNTLVLRVDLSGDPDTETLLRAVRGSVLAMQENQDLPFEQVVDAVGPARRLEHSPLFQVLFAWQSNARASWTLPGVQVEPEPFAFTATRFDLELHLFEQDDEIAGLLGYSTALFDESTILRYRDQLLMLLDGMVSTPSLPFRRLPLIGTAEAALLERWNAHDAPAPVGDRVHHAFERHAERSPGAIALIHGDRRISYAALNALADRWARVLRGRGAGPGQRVGLCIDRGAPAVTAILAVLKTGAAYVPLDPTHPGNRLRQVVEEAAPLLVLADAAGHDALALQDETRTPVIDLARLEEQAPPPAGSRPDADEPSREDDAAYVIYTSGSTGTPKGVVMPHRPLLNLLGWQTARTARSGSGPLRTLQYAAPGFDVAFQEIFATLSDGAALVLVESELRLRFGALVALLRRENVQRVFLPYAALQALAEAMEEEADAILLPALREVIVAGEQLRLTPQIRRLFRRLPECSLHNHYGPTETHVVTAEILPAARIPDAPSHVPIGRPIWGARAYLLDGHGRPIPVGAVGELFIGGAPVATGYLHRPELTAERFGPDPFAGAGARMYRTGDLARHLSDGRLVFVGRDDRQLKIRGFRVEIGEIEAQLAEHELVRDCGVVLRDDGTGREQLVAYVVRVAGIAADGAPAADASDLAGVLHAHLEHRLPAYMVPAAFVAVDALPLTVNGKLDRDALPAPDEFSFARSGYEPPQGDTEIALARLWQDLLGVPRVGRQDRFFELGGHSLLSVRLLSRIGQVFNTRLKLATLFATPVLRDLAAAIEAESRRRDGNAIPAVAPAARAARLPLSHAQQRLWFLAQLDAAHGANYHLVLDSRLRGRLDADALASALGRLIDRHESLRTVFLSDRGEPYAALLPANDGIVLDRHDLRDQPDPDGSLERLFATARNRPFSLSDGPLLRATLARLAADRFALQITLHHIVADGWSLDILCRDLERFYAEAIGASPFPFNPLPVQYADYAAWEGTAAAADRLREQAEYWRGQLAGAPALLELPTDRARPARQDFRAGFAPVVLDADITRGLRRLARRHGVTLHSVMLAAWAAVLARLAAQDEVVIGIPVSGRGRPELEELIGFFVNTLPLRIALDTPLDAGTLLSRAHRISTDAQSNGELPFERMVDLAGAPRRLDRTPVFQAMLAWQDQSESGIVLPGLDTEHRSRAFDWVKFDLELVLGGSGDGIEGALGYAAALFDRDTIERHVGYLRRMLEGMASDEARIVQRTPILSDAETHLLLDRWNRTDTPFPDQLRIPQLVERRAAVAPDAPALAFDDRRITVGALDARANRLAHHLIELGVRPGERVAVVMGRGTEIVVALLAVMKAGAIYLPLDPLHASARLSDILEDAAPARVLCDPAGRHALSALGVGGPIVIDVTDDRPWSGGPDTPPPVRGIDAGSVAYMIYTSGSTGRPKGVPVAHRGVVSLAHSLARRFAIGDAGRVSQFASISFDASIMEMVMAFAAGATLFLPTAAEREAPAAFLAFVERHRLSHVTLPPAFLQGHDEAPGWSHRPALILAGEASAPALVERWRRHARIFNAYGPTEISICATVWACPDESEDGGSEGSGGEIDCVPIGRPVDNTRLYVLDRHGQPVPRGTVGELFIGGLGVVDGYWRRPELTAERFLADPFAGRPGARLYRSGDLVRHLPDGQLLFLSRNDHQVKLRGFRVELGEIEAQLVAHPLARGAAVLLREDRPGEPRLVAYVVATDDGEGGLPPTLRDHLAARLPAYMVPAAFVVLPRLPLTPHGKLDRAALPVPGAAAFARQHFEAPRGATEEALAALWRDLLGVERVGRRDDFFELGGHSLLAVRLAAAMRDRFGGTPGPRDVFSAPVLENLAALVEAGSAGSGAAASETIDLTAEIVLDDTIAAAATPPDRGEPQQILLTGATGFVGAFLLDALLAHTAATVHCLVRGADEADAGARLDAARRSFGLDDHDRNRVRVVPGDLALPRFGLGDRAFDALAGRIDTIFHNGARVDALHSYRSLKAANVGGTEEILRLAATHAPKHVHYVSTMSTVPPAAAAGPGIDTASALEEWWPGLPSGYARSKWVAERILRLGRERGIPSTTYRLTHVGASLGTGASNPNDTWSLFIDACLALQRVPAIGGTMNSLPADVAASTIVALSLDRENRNRELNLLSPRPFPLGALIAAIEREGGPEMRKIDHAEWRSLCAGTLGDARVALILPEEAPPSGAAPVRPAPIVLPNALAAPQANAAFPEAGRFVMTDERLRRYVAWRRRHISQRQPLPASGRPRP
ncbi:amino acid adenylation domain-containing protein [Rhizosaccharibacter radicis]|uniref:Amino acid adenylation domain-containing protein n=1 Tax=Rhizosaccharibacter radicis TaxID=2782605 RepID=A0ABT1W3T7_9PROT|nr:amino acid adenylation domain-containing protein [Acetobacteraceae bacterium KSS12]